MLRKELSKYPEVRRVEHRYSATFKRSHCVGKYKPFTQSM